MSQGTFIQITANDNSADACDWALMLLRMYRMWAERKGLSVEILDYQEGSDAGIHSAIMLIGDADSYATLRNETGIHYMRRESPFDSRVRLTSACVRVCQLADGKAVPTAFIRWSKEGGQGVMMTYDGITVRCNHSRDVVQNIQLGLQVLSGLVAFQKAHEVGALHAVRSCNTLNPHNVGSRYGVWNHKTGELLTREVQRMLNGEIDEFLTPA